MNYSSTNKLIIISHGSTAIGGGHLNRCLALSEGFTSLGYQTNWLVNDAAVSLLSQKGVPGNSIFSLQDLFSETSFEQVLSLLENICPSLCVIDSYAASPSLNKTLRRRYGTVIIDDFRPRPLEEECDILLNYNLGAESLGYFHKSSKLLLGPQFALLRKNFWNLKGMPGEKILIIPGAGDSKNTAESFAGWWGEDWPSVELILGPFVGKEKVRTVSDIVQGKPNVAVTHNPPDLPQRMASARSIICTSSVTAYEALTLRKPTVVFQVAENQIKLGEEIEKRGLGINLGTWGTFGPEELNKSLSPVKPSPPNIVNQFGAKAAAREIVDWIKKGR
jgi:spore coat polysaccharide biosynthesis predicted glycosyltransferase SpsG